MYLYFDNKITKSIGVQVNAETRTAETGTESERETDPNLYQKNLSDIFERLKTKLVDLHSHIEKQNVTL